MLNKLRQQIRELLGIIPKTIREYVSHSFAITNAIKSILNNPVADVITAIIPGTWDDNLKAIIIKALDQTLPYLQIVDKCKGHDNLNDMVLCWIEELRKMPKPLQDALLHKLASLLTAMQDSNELRMSLYDYYTQAEYSGNKVPKAA